MKNPLIIIIMLCWSIFYCSTSQAFNERDEYLTGYMQSIFVFSYNLPAEAINVKEGVVTIQKSMLGQYKDTEILEKIKNATSDLKGIEGYTISEEKTYDSLASNNNKRTRASALSKYTCIAMPNRSLFEPLIADPKWPRFTVAYQRFFKDDYVKHAFAPNFGASFPLYRVASSTKEIEWEVGVQAGLFGLVDIGKKQSALMNADYFVGLPVTYRSGSWSGLTRIYHLSSHLGDEFMLTPEGKRIKRINLSYEGIDFILSHHFDGLRLYGGGGYIVHKEPSYVKPLKFQAGAEYYAENTYFDGMFRPVMGVDVKYEEQGNWYPGVPCKAGLQLENSALISNKVQLMLEFYSGKSMHGQFYKDKIRYVGIGIQAFL